MADAQYLRVKAGRALRLARGSTDRVLVQGLVKDAVRYLARADAVELIDNLKTIARHCATTGIHVNRHSRQATKLLH
jgi:hypothetical protein